MTPKERYDSNKEWYKEYYESVKQDRDNSKLCMKAKKECRKRYNYICQICGNEGLDAHHIVPIKEGGSNDQDNLICLCRSCHERVHNKVFITTDNKSYIINDKFKVNIFDVPDYVGRWMLENNLINSIYKLGCVYYKCINNKLERIYFNNIKAELGIKKTYVKKVPDEERLVNKMLRTVSNWNKTIIKNTNKTQWHSINQFIKDYSEENRATLEELYEIASNQLQN